MSSKSTISKSNYGDVIRTSKLIDASNLRRNETTDNCKNPIIQFIVNLINSAFSTSKI